MKEKHILRIFDITSICLIILLVGIIYSRNSNPLPKNCSHCRSQLEDPRMHKNSQCMVYHWNGKKECYCCAHCAFPERMKEMKLGYQIRKTMVNDYETGKILNVKKAYYLVGSDIEDCCQPSVLAFQSSQQAEKYQLVYHGTITRLGI